MFLSKQKNRFLKTLSLKANNFGDTGGQIIGKALGTIGCSVSTFTILMELQYYLTKSDNSSKFFHITVNGWIISEFFFHTKIHIYHTHLNTHSVNHYIVHKICILGYSTNLSYFEKNERKLDFFTRSFFVTKNR